MLFFLAALFFFACMDTTTKYLAADYDVPLIVAVRYIVNCALMIAILAPSQGRALVQTERTGLVVLRALCLSVLSLLIGLALQRMPVAETTAIMFLSPLLVVLIARPLLGERIGLLGWLAAVTGFAGVLLIARPGSALDGIGVVLALGAAAGNAAYQLLSRVLASTERTLALLFYTSLVGSILYGAGLPWFWEGKAPTPWQAVLFVSLGINAGMGHYLFTRAYRYASASLLAPVSYLQLLWAGLLGWAVFEHVPDGLTTLGMCVVAVAGAMVGLKSRRPGRQGDLAIMSRRCDDEPAFLPSCMAVAPTAGYS